MRSVLIPSFLFLTFSLLSEAILNGMFDTDKNYLYTVLIEKERDTCSGVIIGPKHVLTSADCVTDLSNQRWYGRIRRDPLQVVSGTNNTFSFVSPSKQIISVEKVFSHKQWKKNMKENKKMVANIAVLELTSEISLNEYVKSVLLPEPNEKYKDNENGGFSSFGVNSLNGGIDGYLRFSEARIYKDSYCKMITFGEGIFKDVVCANLLGSIGVNREKIDRMPCYGDNGGPLTRLINNGSIVLVGIRMLPRNNCQDVEVGDTAYTDIRKYSKFITDVMNGNENPDKILTPIPLSIPVVYLNA